MATVAAMDFEANICQRIFRLAEGTYSKRALFLEWADDTWTRQRSNQLARSLVTDFWRDGSSYRGLLRVPGGDGQRRIGRCSGRRRCCWPPTAWPTLGSPMRSV